MNKNLKKILILCIYNITLSANIALCCETNLSLILNNFDEKPSLTTINEMFGYITYQNFNNQQNTEQIDANSETKKRKIPITDLLNPETNPSKKPDKIQKTENKYTKNKAEYIELDFSSVDIPQNYNETASKVGGKSTLVIIKCPDPNCTKTTSGLLKVVRQNMRNHIKRMHSITHSTNELEKKFAPDAKIEENYIELSFLSITTQEQYDKWAFIQPNRKSTKVIINCPLCYSKRTGLLHTARIHMLTHIEEKHLICRCGKGYKSIMQIEDCKKLHKKKLKYHL